MYTHCQVVCKVARQYSLNIVKSGMWLCGCAVPVTIIKYAKACNSKYLRHNVVHCYRGPCAWLAQETKLLWQQSATLWAVLNFQCAAKPARCNVATLRMYTGAFRRAPSRAQHGVVAAISTRCACVHANVPV